jgi:hypothetical protein
MPNFHLCCILLFWIFSKLYTVTYLFNSQSIFSFFFWTFRTKILPLYLVLAFLHFLWAISLRFPIQTPTSSLYPVSAPATRFFIQSKVFLSRPTLNLLKLHIHTIFRTPPTNQSPQFTNTPFCYHIWHVPTSTATNYYLLFIFLLTLI